MCNSNWEKNVLKRNTSFQNAIKRDFRKMIIVGVKLHWLVH